MKHEPWRYHFYGVTRVIPKPTHSIAEAWEALPLRNVQGSLDYLCDWETCDYLDRSYPVKPRRIRLLKRRARRAKSYFRWATWTITADELRSLLPVPDAEDLETAATGGSPSAWEATPATLKALRAMNGVERRAYRRPRPLATLRNPK